MNLHNDSNAVLQLVLMPFRSLLPVSCVLWRVEDCLIRRIVKLLMQMTMLQKELSWELRPPSALQTTNDDTFQAG